jgi:inner membrane protein
MDNLTHSLTGLALSRAGLARQTRGGALALVLASNLPDVDVVTALGGETSYLAHHRGLSHSVVAAPFLALLLAGALRMALHGSHLRPLLLASFVGVLAHVFMDLWTSYGTRVLEPFTACWYTMDLVFIVDPVVLLVLLFGAFWPGRLWDGSRSARTCLALLLSYVAARGVLHARALERIRSSLQGQPVVRAAALPFPGNPFVWRALVDTGRAYLVGEVPLLENGVSLERREKASETDAVVAARSTPAAAVFLDFSSFPWLEVRDRPDGWVVSWVDLRFQHAGRRSFEARVVVARDGRILSQGFRF